MKYVDEYRDRAKAQRLVGEISRLAGTIDRAHHSKRMLDERLAAG